MTAEFPGFSGDAYFSCEMWRIKGAVPPAARPFRHWDFARPVQSQAVDLLSLFNADRHFPHEKYDNPGWHDDDSIQAEEQSRWLTSPS